MIFFSKTNELFDQTAELCSRTTIPFLKLKPTLEKSKFKITTYGQRFSQSRFPKVFSKPDCSIWHLNLIHLLGTICQACSKYPRHIASCCCIVKFLGVHFFKCSVQRRHREQTLTSCDISRRTCVVNVLILRLLNYKCCM